MITLSPTLERLAENLFCEPSPADLQSVPPEPEDSTLDSDGPDDVVISAAVRDAIASHVAARAFLRPEALKAGEIVLLDRIGMDAKQVSRQLGAAVGVLLVNQKLAGVWDGLVVAGELDYAAQFDVFIEEGDEPVDPAMRFIQAWNPVKIVPRVQCRRLGVLSAARLAAIAEVSKEALAGSAPSSLPASLTRIGLRQLQSGASVVTGTSLGNLNDPRRHYQSLYKALAREASVPSIAFEEEQAREPSAEQTGPQIPPTWKSWLWPALTGIAATLLIGQNLLFQNQIEKEKLEAFRSAAPATASSQKVAPRLRVTFKPNVSYESVAKAMRDLGAQFVSGPDENGDVLLSVSADRIQEAATVLRIRDLVDSVEIIPEKKEAAK
jgi:hypothetical protein